jgi:hypothetical protein
MPAYKVDVELTLTGTIMDALKLVAGAQGLGMVAAAVSKVEAGFAGWRSVLVGGAGIAVGASVLGALWAIAKEADKTQDAIAKLRLQNLPTAEFEKNVTTATATGMKLGVKPDIAQEAMNKIQSMVSDPERARAVLEPVLRMGKILESFHKGGVEQVLPIVRMLEETNLITDPGRAKDLDKIIERLGKTLVQSGGTINPTQIQLSNVYARTARYGYTSPEALAQEHPFFTDVLPYYAQMSGRAGQGGGGAAIMSMYSKVHGMGLSKHSKAIAGTLDLMGEGGQLKGADKFDLNPYEWVQDVLVPAIKEKMGLTDSKKQQTAIASIIQHLFGTRLAADPATEFALAGRGYRGEESPFEQHFKRLDRSSGLESVEKLQQTSPTSAAERLSAQWDHLWTNISKALTPERLQILNGLADGIQHLADQASKVDPKTIEAIAAAIGSLGAALATAGLVTILTQLVGKTGLIAGLGAAILALSPQVRDAVAELPKAIASADSGKIAEAGLKLAGSIITALIQGLDAGVEAAKGAIAAVAKRISDTLFRAPDAFQKSHPYFGNKLLHPETPSLGFGTPPKITDPGMLHRTSGDWGGGGGGKSATINNVIYLDGAAIARAVHDYMISGIEHPVQAPHFDGRDGHTSVDHQPITT